MMDKNIKMALVFLMICFADICMTKAQDRKIDKANQAYNEFAFIEAAKLYEEAISKGDSSFDIYTKLGDCYYYNGKYPQAATYYSKIINASEKINPEYYFRYAQALNNSQKYGEAEQIMRQYYAKTGKKDLSANWNEKKLLDEIQKQSGRYVYNAVDINSPFSDFGTTFLGKDKVIYSSAKDTGVIIKPKHSWNKKSFLKLYTADVSSEGGLQNPILLKGEINTRYHQSTAAITKDGKTMFFTRNNYKDGKLAEDKNGISYLKIYTAQNINGEWKNIKELGYPVNSDGFSSAHPAINADESELYFVSDRNNSFGNSDLYVVSLRKGGFVGNDVTKLSDEINTLGRETYPFVDSSGILYFSSDGHPGLGGLDVFAAVKDDQGVYHVANLGDGVNTNEDDFAYIINDDTKKGYFSSDRSGNDDIYNFTQNRPVTFDFDYFPKVYGTLKFTTGVPIENVTVQIYNVNEEIVKIVYSDKDGKYNADLEAYKDYKLVYKKVGIAERSQVAPPFRPSERREYSFEFVNEKEVIVDGNKVQLENDDDLTHKLKLLPIYFDYNGYKIRESSKAELNKVVDLMKTHSTIKLTVNSHTDSRGHDEFNMKLSESRAKATVDYIINHGINSDRITGKGYGETRLLNKCSNGVKCSETEHQLNRRSEFIIQFD